MTDVAACAAQSWSSTGPSSFFVLDGQATFYGPDEQSTVVGRYEGIF